MKPKLCTSFYESYAMKRMKFSTVKIYMEEE